MYLKSYYFNTIPLQYHTTIISDHAYGFFWSKSLKVYTSEVVLFTVGPFGTIRYHSIICHSIKKQLRRSYFGKTTLKL